MKIPSHEIQTKSDEQAHTEGATWENEDERICEFLEKNIVLDTGEPFVALPYQRDIIRRTYNFRRADGRRLKKLALVTLGRKNGKTALTYGLTGYHLLADGTYRPRCASCAVNQSQAAQIYDGLKWSIDARPKLAECLHVVESKKTITYPAKGGKYESLASDSKGRGKYGHGHSFVVYDELAFHANDSLWTALQNSGDAIPTSLQVIISSAGWNKNGAFFRLYQHAKKCLSGEIVDPTFAPFIWETPEEIVSDPVRLDDTATWRLANPALGVCLNEDDFRAQWERSKRDVAGRLDFLRLKFNSWTDAEAGWIPVEKWEACQGTFPTFTKSTPCFVAIDAGQTQDLTAVVAVFLVGGRYYVRSWAFVPSQAVENRDKQNAITYERFVLDKSLKVIPGAAVGVEADLYPFVNQLLKDYDVKCIVVDRWQMRQFTQHYLNRGHKVFEFNQRHYMYHGACQAVERAVLAGDLVHDGNSLLRWQIGHVELDREKATGYVMPKKPGGQEAAKIDNVCALCMAMSQAVQFGSEVPFESVYKTRGVFVF